MVIRNINIYNASNKLVRSWELRQHNINEVFDTITYQKAIALNGVWEVDKHAKWKKLTSFKIKGLNPQIAYDKRNGLIFVVKNEFLYKYSLVLNKVDTLRTLNGNPYSSITNNLIYNLLSNKLISYRVGSHLFSEYDFQNNSWSQSAEGLNDKAMLHNSVIAEDRDELITFGGYGFHLYNAVLTKYALSNNSMKSKDISTFIEPRYLSSADYCGNGELYVLGGYGCKTGIQDGFTQNYYDLHLINTDSMTCRKLWEFKNDNQFFTFSKSMVIDKEHKYLYSLTYENDKRNTSVQLVRFGLNSPDKKVFADTISYRFHDLSSFCDLFRNEGSNELIAILLYLENNETVINFYSLPLPPLNEADTIQPISKSSSWPWRIPIFVMLIVIVLFIGYYIVNRKEKKKTIFPEDLSPVENKGIIKHAPAIYLLGGLQIIDTQGNDITGRFTSTTKSLFLIILLKSLQNGEGITSQFIDDTLWFNMYKDSAINNRNVNMRKLRLLLKELGSVTISNDNSYWRLDLGEEVYCDYKEVLRLINEIKTRQYNKINKALDIVIKGNLLPDANYEWIDNYKSDYSNLIINVLSEISKYPEIKKDLKLLLRISNAMLAQDAIDEDAISLKCYALYHLGKKGLALATFNNFSEKYKKILSSTPKIEFEEIIKD